MNIKTENVISVQEWDKMVANTYGRPYKFQQQDGCKDKGMFRLTVPCEVDDFEKTIVPEVVNHHEMGVSFSSWLARDPKQPLGSDEECRLDQWAINMWWHRNFYPSIEMVANDLFEKGLLPQGEYVIEIDW